MECDRYPEHGAGASAPVAGWACGVKRKLGAGACALRLDIAAAVRGARGGGVLATPPRTKDPPFINNMDEITFWIVTKRAPCLLNFDNPLRKQEAQSTKPQSIPSAHDTPPPKKKKRKLAGLDNDSINEKSNFFIDHQTKCKPPSSAKSNTLISDVDFNIKKSSVQAKSKRTKGQKNSRTTLNKKNKVVTSTPKGITNLRRSLRTAQSSFNNNSQLKTSISASVTNGNLNPILPKSEKKSVKKNLTILASGDQSMKNKISVTQNASNGVINGQYEDSSDVSGFTANYIRSTRVNSKTPRKLRGKPSRNLVKESKQKEDTLVVSVNKAMNTGHNVANHNCSTDSSQNIISLVTTEPDSKPVNVDKSTSLLKFVDSKANRTSEVAPKPRKDNRKKINGTNLDISFQSSSTTGSRYPKRNKNVPATEIHSEQANLAQPGTDRRRRVRNTSERNEHPSDVISRTRSGRNKGLVMKQPENSVYVISNSTEHVSSVATFNVGSPANVDSTDNSKKKRVPKSANRVKKSLNKTGHSAKDSFREKSGFAACFSDSDDDKPLMPQKFLS